jgi:hypothetical protein
MVRIGEYVFLDFFPDGKMECPQADLFMPVHIPCRMWLDGDRLSFGPLNPSWLKERLKKRTLSIKHEVLGGGKSNSETYLLTASTPELRKFYARCARNSDAFVRPEPFTRQGSQSHAP